MRLPPCWNMEFGVTWICIPDNVTQLQNKLRFLCVHCLWLTRCLCQASLPESFWWLILLPPPPILPCMMHWDCTSMRLCLALCSSVDPNSLSDLLVSPLLLSHLPVTGHLLRPPCSLQQSVKIWPLLHGSSWEVKPEHKELYLKAGGRGWGGGRHHC